MAAGPAAAFLADGRAASPASKCRYKTGKCTNTRSSKRNGQPHQLCLYHREKANKIQRKFDRQKRQVAKVKKSSSAGGAARALALAAGSSALGTPSSGNMLDLSPAAMFALSSPFGTSGELASPSSSSSSSSSFATLAAHDVDIYSDSDSSRFSTDSESSVVLDQVWADLPRSAMQLLQGDGLASPTGALAAPSVPVGCHQSYLSSDELDFLCSAILE